MSPATGKGDGRRPTVKPAIVPVVPALPLTYAQQRPAASKSTAPTTKAPSKPSSTTQAQSNQHETPKPQKTSSATAQEHPAFANGGSSLAITSTASDNQTPTAPSQDTLSSKTITAAESPASPQASVFQANGKGTTPKAARRVSTEQSFNSPPPTSGGIVPTSSASGQTATASVPTHGVHDMAPFVPATMAYRPRLHQPNPSTGSLQFGAFNDSNASSPGPHSASGFPAPPPLQPPNPALASLRSNMMLPMDGYGPTYMVSPSADGFAPLAAFHGPPTPHSFLGSQSSMPGEENGQHAQYAMRNGHEGYTADVALPPMPLSGMIPPMSAGYLPPPPPPGPAAGADFANFQIREQTLQYVRDGAVDNEYSDCTLRVRFLDKAPVSGQACGENAWDIVLPMHRFMLARSPTLRQVIRTAAPTRGGTIDIELVGEYMHADAFVFTLRMLYGWDFGDGRVLPHSTPFRNVHDELDLALGYMSAAQYLLFPQVFAMGVQHAGRLMAWETLERIFKFLFLSLVFSPPRRPGLASPRDEYDVSDLQGRLLGFIVHNMPVDFVLDTDIVDIPFCRLPVVDSPPAPTTSVQSLAPLEANGTASHAHDSVDQRASSDQSPAPSLPQGQSLLPRVRHRGPNSRLSSIKFGDISPPNVMGNGFDHGPNSQMPGNIVPRRRKPNARDSALSRVLLNLPFDLLKHVLEHPNLGKASGEFDPGSRFMVIAEIIAEREARRKRALEMRNTPANLLLETLERAADPLAVVQFGDFMVNNMGFKEEVFPGDVPYLVHTWTRGDLSSINS